MGLLSKLLSKVSGNSDLQVSEQLLFDKVIGFRGIVPGCGVSTIVQNTAIALSQKTKYTICVLDTSFLYPIQYPLLVANESNNKQADILDFANDISKITIATKYPNVYLVNLSERTIVDLLSGKDSADVLERVMASLKSFFDIILVDLSSEFTNIATHSAIKCNKIYQVADSSLKCLYNVKKSMNTMATLAVPLAKANNVILNKQLTEVVLGVNSAMAGAGLQVIGEIPLSIEIAALGASGKPIYLAATKDASITMFNTVIDQILAGVAESTPKTMKYFNIKKTLEAMEKEKKELELQGNQFIDTTEEDDDLEIVEIEDADDLEEINVKEVGDE